MLKRFGQMLVMLAVVASVLNAQCAIACSITTHEISAGQTHTRPQAASADHACCPATKNPEHSRTQGHAGDKLPCPDSHSATLNNDQESFAPELSVGPIAALPSPAVRAIAPPAVTGLYRSAPFTPPLPATGAFSFAVLRI